MVGHICRFDPRYAIAKKSIEEGKIGRIVSLYARRNIPASVSESVLTKIGPLLGDGVHDTDLFLWYIQEKVKTVYAKTLNIRNLPNPDIGWATVTFESGAIGVFGQRAGVLKEELAYFVRCCLSNTRPSVITPEESREAVKVMLAAEEGAAFGKIVYL